MILLACSSFVVIIKEAFSLLYSHIFLPTNEVTMTLPICFIRLKISIKRTSPPLIPISRTSRPLMLIYELNRQMTLLRSSNFTLIKLGSVFFAISSRNCRSHSSTTEIPIFISYCSRKLAHAQMDLTFLIFLAIITCPLGIKPM